MGRTDVCLFVCLLVFEERMEIQTPETIGEILHTHSHLSKEGFGEDLTPGPSLPRSGGDLKYKRLNETFLKDVYKTKDVQQVAN